MFDQSFFAKLVDEKIVSKQDFDSVIAEGKKIDRSLFDLFLEKKILSEFQLLKFFAQQNNINFFEKISDKMVDPVILSKIPFNFLKDNSILPVLDDSVLYALTSHPKYMQAIDQIVLLLPGFKVEPGFATKTLINDAINKYYPFDAAQEAIDELNEEQEADFDLEDIKQDILNVNDDAPIVKLVNHIMFQAVKEGASDIHIEIFEKELKVRYRIDGVMHVKFNPPKRYHGAIISRIKIISNLNIAEKRIPQDGRIQVKIADKSIDLRVSVLPCNFGERVVMRILDKSKGVTALEKLNLNSRDMSVIQEMMSRPNGIILVSGPTGSGKTTTLYSVLERLNDEDSNIITVEDPVEYTMSGVNQVQVNVKTGLTFASALRSILRQDPDIALIGEIRDGETAQIAIQAALTGHLVLSTIHTNSAPATVTRLIDMGIEPFLIASSLICVIAQRLVRSLCQACKEPYVPAKEILDRFANYDHKAKNTLQFYKAKGCSECLNTGYKGRLALFEVMKVNEEVSSQIVQGADSIKIKQASVKDGMKTLAMDGFDKAASGLTTLEEVLSVAFIEN